MERIKMETENYQFLISDLNQKTEKEMLEALLECASYKLTLSPNLVSDRHFNRLDEESIKKGLVMQLKAYDDDAVSIDMMETEDSYIAQYKVLMIGSGRKEVYLELNKDEGLIKAMAVAYDYAANIFMSYTNYPESGRYNMLYGLRNSRLKLQARIFAELPCEFVCKVDPKITDRICEQLVGSYLKDDFTPEGIVKSFLNHIQLRTISSLNPESFMYEYDTYDNEDILKAIENFSKGDYIIEVIRNNYPY